MPLSLYAGPMKMGKTYEVVAQVMIPAFQRGRDIVTNVRGIVPEYWNANLAPIAGHQLGTITVVDDEFLADEAVYPQFDKKNVRDTGQMPPGALVVIDEAYNVFGTDRGMVTARMLKWVMMHGHFTNEAGICADIVMIAQDLSLLAPKVRNVAESVFWVRNLRFVHSRLGKKYRVTAYSSWRMTLKQLLGRKVRSYSDGIFPFYKSTSHEGGGGRLAVTDRGATAMGPMFVFFAALSVLAIGYGIWAAWGLLHPAPASPRSIAGISEKPDCTGSGVLLDLDGRRALVEGEWRDASIAPVSMDGRVGWDVGRCVFRFGGRADRGSRSAQDGGGGSGQAVRPDGADLLAGRFAGDGSLQVR